MTLKSMFLFSYKRTTPVLMYFLHLVLTFIYHPLHHNGKDTKQQSTNLIVKTGQLMVRVYIQSHSNTQKCISHNIIIVKVIKLQ